MSPDMEEELLLLKKKLKKWEKIFILENQRKPNKEDISAAPDTVQDMYKRYAQLKKCADTSVKDEVNCSVWGAELNKNTQNEDFQPSSKSSKKKSTKTSVLLWNHSLKTGTIKHVAETEEVMKQKHSEQEAKVKGSLMSKLGKKLLEKSVNIQNASRQNLASSPSMSCSDLRKSTFLGKVEKGSSLLESQNENMTTAKTADNVEEPDPDENTLNGSFFSVLSGVTVKQKQVPLQKHDPVDIPFGFASGKKDFKLKYKYVNNFESEPDLEKERGSINAAASTAAEISDDFETLAKSPAFEDFDDADFDFCDVNENCQKETKPEARVQTWSELNKPISGLRSDNTDKSTQSSAVTATQKIGCQSHRGKKRQAVDSETDAKPNSKRQKKSRASSKENEETPETSLQTEEAKLENNKTSTNSKKVYSDKRTRTTSKAVTSGNYVRLNLKVKRYTRKGQNMTGGKYKRMQWKAKMKARSESFGSDKCFKCGQTGHWANKCMNSTKPSIPEINTDSVLGSTVRDEDFPTVVEAFKVSRGIKNDSKKSTQQTKTEQAEGDDALEDTRLIEGGLTESDIEMEIVREGHTITKSQPPCEPLYQLESDGTVPEPDDDVMNALKLFGFESFKPGQKEAIMRILCGLSTLVILSTGSGKSLCYQLPAYLYATKCKAITLVISPLVSLMEDQVTGLPACVKGACLHTNMTKGHRQKVIEEVKNGNIHFLLVSPEAMTSSSSMSLLQSSELPQIAFVCIDEVHCVSEWSHHFRPSYLRICKVLKEHYGVKCMLGLTATATMVTAASISQHLHIGDYLMSTIRDLPVPSNLLLSASRDQNKDQALLALLQGDRFSACPSIIIYCTRRQQTDQVATLIRTHLQQVRDEEPKEVGTTKAKGKKKTGSCSQWAADSYHAGLSPAARRRIQKAFMSGKLRVVVATVAFGMGVDKSDVRGIIHYSVPKSFESYVQEIGRAGRDGETAHCHIFLDHEGNDINELRRHIYSNTIDRYIIKKLVRKLFVPCKCREKQAHKEENENGATRICPGHERAIPIDKTVQELDIKEEGIATLLCYLELHPKAWLINLQHVYATCTIQCYGGPEQLRSIAKKCPPVGVAIAMQQKRGVSFADANSVTFPVVDISDTMAWDSGTVKRELSRLQWDLSGTAGVPRKSGVLVSFTDLAFHLRSYGDLTDDELEEVVGFLTERIQTQERTELGQLKRLQETLKSVSHKDVWMCADCVDVARSDKLKEALRQYFDEKPEIKDGHVTMLSFAREYGTYDSGSVLEEINCPNVDQLRADIRQFINIYSSEHVLSGRVIARIFHGIGSPCYPANIWGRVRRFWRSHLDVDFNLIRKLATQELIRSR